jgi:hypothetical protein
MTTSHHLENLIFDQVQISEIAQIIRWTSENTPLETFLNISNYLYQNNLVYSFDWANWEE